MKLRVFAVSVVLIAFAGFLGAQKALQFWKIEIGRQGVVAGTGIPGSIQLDAGDGTYSKILPPANGAFNSGVKWFGTAPDFTVHPNAQQRCALSLNTNPPTLYWDACLVAGTLAGDYTIPGALTVSGTQFVMHDFFVAPTGQISLAATNPGTAFLHNFSTVQSIFEGGLKINAGGLDVTGAVRINGSLGISGIVPLGPYTVGGTTGSLTIANGIIIGATNPT